MVVFREVLRTYQMDDPIKISLDYGYLRQNFLKLKYHGKLTFSVKILKIKKRLVLKASDLRNVYREIGK